jgi:DNA-binding MarR family transcriptional regulator
MRRYSFICNYLDAAMTQPQLILEDFLPYRLSLLANLVSTAVARLYESRFDLKLPEWRIMAVLGRAPGHSASEIADITAMDKVAISRALARLIAMGRVESADDPADGRRQRLKLSAAGAGIYAEIVPLALSVEQRLLDRLSPADRAALDQLIGVLTTSARLL